jgi:hypothetical protein
MEMGELIIHIDQHSGAVLKVEQTLTKEDKEALLKKEENKEETFILSKIKKTLEDLYPERAKKNKEVDQKFVTWLESTDESFTVELPPLGDPYNDDPELVKWLKAHKYTFDRIVTLPVELWERKGNTICTVNIGGVARRCRH